MISLTDTQKIGMGLTGFGVFFLFFGMLLFFDKALLAIGNVLFVAGLAFVIGLERTFRFFFQKHKVKATAFFLGGVLVVLVGWPLIGMVLEIYGFFLLFRGFFPVVIGFIRRVPVLGSILNLPGISSDSGPLAAACTLILLMSSSVFPGSGGLPQSHFQRRNWTPQAMLYLKGAQGRRFISDESQRKDLYDRLQLETRSRNSSPITISEAAAMFLSSLQKAQEEAEDGAMEQAGYLPESLFSW